MNPVASHFIYSRAGAFSVDWYIGKRCNYECSYCADYLHDKTSPHAPIKYMKKLVDMIHEKHGANVFWSLTGGEPTLNPDFLELCKYIKEDCGAKNVSLTTNGSRSADYYKKIFLYLNYITISFHFEYMEKKIDEYIKKCIEIELWRRAWNKNHLSTKPAPTSAIVDDEPKELILRFMVYPGQLSAIKKMTDAFHAAGIKNIEYRQIRPQLGKETLKLPIEKRDIKASALDIDSKIIKERLIHESKYYSEFEKEEINRLYFENSSKDNKKLKLWFESADGSLIEKNYHYNELNFDGKNKYKGWLCWAGAKHLKITPNGDVYIGSCHSGGRRGNIFKPETIDLPSEPIICPKWRCTDNLDLKVPKISDKKYMKIVEKLI